MGFKPLEEIEGPIELTLRGKTYTLPTIMWEDGVRLQQLIADGNGNYGEIVKVLLGGLLTELSADGASAQLIDRVSAVALAEWRYGRDAAERTWENPKALLELNQAIQTAITSKATETPSGEASTTPTPDSGSGTPSPTKAPKATRSRGKKSSGTGASS